MESKEKLNPFTVDMFGLYVIINNTYYIIEGKDPKGNTILKAKYGDYKVIIEPKDLEYWCSLL